MTDLYQFIFFHWIELLIVWFCISLGFAIHFGAAVRYGNAADEYEPDTKEINDAWEQRQEVAYGKWRDIEVVEE